MQYVVGALHQYVHIVAVDHVDKAIVELLLDLLGGEAHQLMEALADEIELKAPVHRAAVVAAGNGLVDVLQLGHVLGGAVEVHALLVFLHEVHLQRYPGQRAVGLVHPHHRPGAVQPVRHGPLQQPEELFPVFRVHELLDGHAPGLQLVDLDAHHLVELLVVAYDVHAVAVPAIDGHRAEDVVQHHVADQVLIQEFPGVELVVGLELKAVQVHVPGIGDQIFKLLHRHGPIEVIALHVAAAQVRQEVDLLDGLHALDDHGNGHGLGHVDDGFQYADALAGFVLADVQELGVQLDDVHVQAAEHVQRGIAAAEVVHQHQEAQAAQAAHRLPDGGGVLDIGGFGDLDLDQPRGQPVFLQQSVEEVGHVDGKDVDLGDVHRYGHRGVARVDPLAQPRADPLPYVLVQVGDDAVLFKDRHKAGRRYDPALGGAPAGQRLRPHDPARRDPALGLQAEEDLVVIQALLELGEDLVFLGVALVHIGIVYLYAVLEVALDLLGGQRGMVVQLRDLVLGAFNQADAEHRQKAHGIALGLDHPLQLVEQQADARRVVGNQQLEVVLAAIARQAAGLPLQPPQYLADLRQQKIAALLAVPVAEQFEVLNVKRHHAPLARQRGQPLPGQGIEFTIQQQAGQVVPADGGPGRGGAAQLPLLLDVDIVHVAVDHALGQAVLGPRDQHLAHPPPFAVHRPVAQLLAEHAGNLRTLQAQNHGVGVHQPAVALPVLGIDHMIGAIAIELAPVAVQHGHIVLVFHMPEVSAAVVDQVDLHQLVVGRTVQPVQHRLIVRLAAAQVQPVDPHDLTLRFAGK